MNTRNPINITKSSLIGLQAELARKKEEVNYNRNYEQNKVTKLELKPHIQEQLASLKPKKDTKTSTSLEDVDSSILEQSRDALLAKSKLYEKLRNQKVTTADADQFLVNFKAEMNVNVAEENQDEDSDHESEWVTFVDSLGRSRTCLRTDLEYYKKLDSNISTSMRSETSVPEEKRSEERTQVKESPAISEEMQLWYKKREALRKIWEEEEKRLSEKKDIHYQDILFEEARMHGVGYFHFSKDEAERQEQREALNKLREETEKNQMISMTLKERREQQMKQRIEAAKKRKRERLGLPPEAETKTEPEQDELSEAKKAPDDKEDLARRIDELLQNVERSRHVRPWDIGKDGVKPRVLTQHEWNERQRSKRIEEFAPPSFYKKTREETNSSHFIPNRADFGVKSVPINFEYDSENDINVKKLKRKRAEIAPPSSYEKSSLPTKSKTTSLSESIEMGLNRLRHEAEKKNKEVNQRVLDVDFE